MGIDEKKADKITKKAPIVNEGGFHFATEKDAKEAEIESKKIVSISKQINLTKSSDVKLLFDKAVDSKTFKTPIGWIFLYQLRGRLLKMGMPESDIKDIPIDVVLTHTPHPDDYVPSQRIERAKEKEPFPALKFSIIINLLLALMVIAMFFIANYSGFDNIINYKRNITNRYASWEEDLKEREKTVREKEKELGIEDSSTKADEVASSETE